MYMSGRGFDFVSFYDISTWFDYVVFYVFHFIIITFQNIYNHTTLMMSYEMSHNFSNRRDLALTYYPSKFECYWFIARTVTLLRRYKATQPLPFKVRFSPLIAILYF